MTEQGSWYDDFGVTLDAPPPQLKRVRRGEVIFDRGDPSQSLYRVRQGRVRLVLPDQFALRIACPGQFFGELALVGESRRRWTAVAMYPCVVVAAPAVDLRAAAARWPEVAAQVLRIVGRSADQLDARLEDLVGRSVTERLTRTLLRLADDCGRSGPDGVNIGGFTHHELAQLIAATRERTTIALGQLEGLGLIAKSRAEIVVRDADGLREYALAAAVAS